MHSGTVVHCFGPFELDPGSGRLFRGPARVRRSDPQAAILLRLVAHAGQVVSKAALVEAGWGAVAVGDNSLDQAMSRVAQDAWADSRRRATSKPSRIRATGSPHLSSAQRAGVCRNLSRRHAGTAAVAFVDALTTLPSPAAGWILPVEPLLHTAARPSIWADALAIVRQRAV